MSIPTVFSVYKSVTQELGGTLVQQSNFKSLLKRSRTDLT